MNSRTKFSLTVSILSVMMIVAAASVPRSARAGGPWYVAPGGTNGNTCLSAMAPCATINGALGKASPGDIVLIATGTYTGTGTEVVFLNNSATLSGGWNSDFSAQSGMSTIDGGGTRMGMNVDHGGMTVTVERFIIQNGLAVIGGIYNNSGTLTLNNSTVSGNTATGYGIVGGGILNNGGTLSLNNSTISDNVAIHGSGGIASEFGTTTLNNSTISGNTSQSNGGGIYNFNGTVTLNNSTVSGNTAPYGGGIYNDAGTVTLQNSILAGNTGGTGSDCNGSISSSGHNLIDNTTGCTFTLGAGDLTNVDAHLGQLIGSPGYDPLLSNSPAIDAGNPATCLATDQRGVVRPQGSFCDIGAYEYTTPGAAASLGIAAGSNQRAAIKTVFSKPLIVYILDSNGSPVSGVTVTFTAPSSGASGTFADTSTGTTTAVSNNGGPAISSAFTANSQPGSYNVTAAVSGLTGTVKFALTNTLPWYVATPGNDGNTCASPAAPCLTINGALGKLSFVAGDTILVTTGTYTGTGSEVVLLSDSATLSGGWNTGFSAQNGLSTIDGESARRGLSVNSGVSAIVTRFAIQHSEVAGSNGDGILNAGTLTLNQVHVHSNAKVDGGGGIINQGTGTLTINNSAVTDNGSINGCVGGIMNNGGSLNINNSTVSGNTSSTISCAPIAGIANQNGSLSLNNVTIANNTGGGLWSYPAGATRLRNTIIAGNTVNGSFYDCNAGDVLNSLGYNLIRAADCTITLTTGDLIGVGARLGPLQDNGGATPTQSLLPDSPAINAGNPGGCQGSAGQLATDQRGYARFGRCDMGAYELQPLGFSVKTVTASKGLPGMPLSYTIALTNGGASIIAVILVTDTLPINLTYHSNSLIATGGTYGFNSGVITWTGSLNAGELVSVTFGATVSQTASMGYVDNSAVISGGGETFTRTASFLVDGQACNLTKYTGNPVLTIGANGAWDDAAIWRPTVLKVGGTYKMWYSASDGTTRRIGLATSPDGIHWTKHPGNPVLGPGPLNSWDQAGVYAPSVIYDGVYKMWYAGHDGIRNQIGYATSPDGISWTKNGLVIDINGAPGAWEQAEVTEPTVIKVGNTYHMWYVGSDGVTLRIGHATSTDGLSWPRDAANPVLDLGASGSWEWLDVYGPSVVKVGDEYRLWYSGHTLPTAYQTGYATSLDGSTWTRQQKLIAEGPLGTFDVYSADYPAVIVDSPGYKIWYSGVNSSGTYNIGYATAGVCSASPPVAGSNLVYLPLVLKGYPCEAYYTDNFSDPNSGWLISDDASRKFAYTGGQYQIQVKNKNEAWFVTPGAKATDFTASVSARRTSGTSGAYGIVFGITTGWNEFFEVLVDANSYSIWRYATGWLALKDWTSSPYIATGTNWNRLKVMRSGAAISVYVNNQFLTTVSSSNGFGGTLIGLAAESDNTTLDARFDDFSLYPASCGATAYAAASSIPPFELGKPEARQLPVPPRLPQP